MQILMCSLQPWTCSQVKVLPRQWVVGPSSDSRLRRGETPAGASSAVNSRQRREGETDSPQGQRPDRASRTGPSGTESARPAHQAVVVLAGAGIINRAEPRACGHSREPIPLDSEPDTERDAGSASNAAGDGCGRARSDKAGFQAYRGKLAVRDEQRGWGKRGQDLMAICHHARKGSNTGSHWSKPVAPPLHSTNAATTPFPCAAMAKPFGCATPRRTSPYYGSPSHLRFPSRPCPCRLSPTRPA